jgi:hypothetical protein
MLNIGTDQDHGDEMGPDQPEGDDDHLETAYPSVPSPAESAGGGVAADNGAESLVTRRRRWQNRP